MTPEKLQPFSLGTKFLLWAGLTLILGILGWSQLIRDEQAVIPEGFAVPAAPEAIPATQDGLAYFRSDEFRKNYRRQWVWLSHIKNWSREKEQGREMTQPLIEAAPEMEQRLEAASWHPDWPEQLPVTNPAKEPWGGNGGGKSGILSGPLKSIRMSVETAKQAGDSQRALKLYELLHRIGSRLNRQAEGMDDLMTASFFCINHAEEGVEGMLVGSHFAPEMMLAAERMLTAPPLERSDVLKAMRWDFLRYRHAMERAGTATPFGSSVEDSEMTNLGWMLRFRFKPQATVNRLMMLEWTAERLTMEPGQRNRRNAADFRAFLYDECGKPALGLHPNSFGRRLAAGRFAGGNARGWEYFEPWMMVIRSLHHCRKAVLAAKRWSLAHEGRRPAALRELVPDYLPEIPLDPYDGQPLKWDHATGTVYAVGDDGVDDLPPLPADLFSVARKDGCAARLP
ncbi:MAG: hypothetical protein EOP84_20050 [Verrucomicrobiaceae bacterium]|nr:MAG: hypothetical protein EOP84_20050 [Verrucomicrobiaceae bacterium]